MANRSENSDGNTDKKAPVRRRQTLPACKRSFANQMFAHGMGYKSVAKILGLSRNTVKVWQRCFKKGLTVSRVPGKRRRWNAETRELVAGLRSQGKSWRVVSEQTGVPVSTCRRWVLAGGAAKESPGTRKGPERRRSGGGLFMNGCENNSS